LAVRNAVGLFSIAVALSLMAGSSFAVSQVILERQAYVTISGPAGPAKSMGYWKNHIQLISEGWEDWRPYVRSFQAFCQLPDDPPNAVGEMCQVFDDADARDMTAMLKAQLLTLALNLASGYVPKEALVDLRRVDGAVGLFGAELMKAEDVVSAVDGSVFSPTPTWTSRWQQETAKDVLDAINNNLLFSG